MAAQGVIPVPPFLDIDQLLLYKPDKFAVEEIFWAFMPLPAISLLI